MALIRFVNQPDSSVLDLALMFVVQMVVGAAIGYGLGKLSVIVLNRLKLETEGLYPVLTLSVVLLAYGLASSFRGNGFLAVYLAGIVMGNSDFIHKRSLVRFHDGLAWLMQITMFVALGMLVYPSRLVPIAGIGLLFSRLPSTIRSALPQPCGQGQHRQNQTEDRERAVDARPRHDPLPSNKPGFRRANSS